jgi:imidazolonepropionase
MTQVDLLIHSAAQVCVMPAESGGPQRGARLGELGLIEDGAVAIAAGRIVAIGPSAELRARYTAAQAVDATGRVVTPGFVDPHTHALFAGDRANEFAMRLAGATYMDIMAAGGGILSTVRATRAASAEELERQTRARLVRMLAHGSTTIEVKTGYGLDTATERKMLDALAALSADTPLDLVPTFLGAHAVPAEYQGRADEYADLVAAEMLPMLVAWEDAAREAGLAFPSLASGPRATFVDVFCEDGAFSLEQTRRILTRAKELGFPLKIHVDEFRPLGGSRLAVELGATSIEHVVTTPPDEVALVAASPVIAVGLPGTPFGLAQRDYTPAQALLAGGGAVAIATDCNPGTTWCESMQMVIALACRYMRLTPAQALAAATINAACALGLGDRVGSLEPGKQADVLVLDVPDYRHLGYRYGTNLVAQVVKRGQVAGNARQAAGIE